MDTAGNGPNLPYLLALLAAQPLSTNDPSPATRPQPEPNTQEQQQESPWVFWRGVLITLGVALGVRQFVIEARYIPSGSMLPGLQIQDRLLVEKLTYRQRPPKRGEIVVFHAPHHFDPVLTSERRTSPLRCLLVNLPLINSVPGLQEPACDAYIKRVVAVAGDRVMVNQIGRAHV